MLGFSVVPRFLGSAVLVEGVPVLLPTLRLPRTGIREVRDRALRALRAEVTIHAPVLAAMDEESVRIAWISPAVREAVALVEGTLEDLGVPVAHVSREEMGRALGIAKATVPAIREIMKRFPLVGMHLGRTRGHGPRSERERYWEPAVVAAAASLSSVKPGAGWPVGGWP